MPPALSAPPARRRRRALWGLALCCAAVHGAVLSLVVAQPPRPGVGATAAVSVRTVEIAATSLPAVPQAVAQVVPSPAAARPAAAAPAGPALQQSAPRAHDETAPTHLKSDALDMPPLPRSAPDAAMVEGLAHSGAPIRLRLYIEADGSVSNVEVQFIDADDEPAARGLAAMFRATAFLPGRLRGRDVASYMDIEVVALPRALGAVPG